MSDGYNFPEKGEKGFKFNDNLTKATYYVEHLKAAELKKLTDDDLKIMRNYPYAVAGYDFSDKKLKDYFSKFIWYMPTGKNVELKYYEQDVVNRVDKVINDRKK